MLFLNVIPIIPFWEIICNALVLPRLGVARLRLGYIGLLPKTAQLAQPSRLLAARLWLNLAWLRLGHGFCTNKASFWLIAFADVEHAERMSRA
jgi:hypothetical protein